MEDQFEDGAVMNADRAEHIKEAAAVMSQMVICWRSGHFRIDRQGIKIIAKVMQSFAQYATVPIINLKIIYRTPANHSPI